jgi:hypothetical protein
VVANDSWCTNFPEAGVTVEAALSFDHAPLWLRLFDRGRRRKVVSAFKYEAHWALQKDCKAIISKLWREKAYQGSRWVRLIKRLQSCKKELTRWNNST